MNSRFHTTYSWQYLGRTHLQLCQEKRQPLCLLQENLNHNVRNPIHTPPFIIAINKPFGKELFVLNNKTKIMSILKYSDIFIIT